MVEVEETKVRVHLPLYVVNDLDVLHDVEMCRNHRNMEIMHDEVVAVWW